MKPFLLTALALMALPAVAGPLYRWVDADGTVHYTDAQPPTSATDVTRVPMRLPAADDTARLPYETQVAARNHPVTLYVTDCGEACTRARELLRKRGIPYTEKDPQQPAEQQELSRLLAGPLEVPVLKVGSSVTRGFSEDPWQMALDVAGYPRSAGAPPPLPKPSHKPEAAPEAPAEAPPQEAPPPEPPPARRGTYPIYSE